MKTLNTLEGIRRGRNFFSGIGTLGKYILLGLGLFTMFSFWALVLIMYEPLRESSLLVIKTIQLGFIMLAFGTLMAWFLDFVYEHIYNKEIRAYQIKESENVRVKRRK